MKTLRIVSFCTALALALAGAAHAGADRPLVLDTHVDIPFAYMHEPRFDVGTDSVLKVDLGKMKRGGLDAAFFIVYVEQGPLTPQGYAHAVAQAETKYSAIESMLQRYPQQIRLATSPNQVVEHHAHGLLSAMIGIENGYSLGHDLDRLDAAHARGARYLGIVHVGNNDLCTSSLPNKDLGEPAISTAGLSEFGRAAVKRANQLGMMVDISHASDACVRDVLAASAAPIIASHSSARALVDHPRNLPDDLLRAIAGKGGVIQVVAYKEFVRKDTGREAAEKALQKQVAQQAGDDEYDSEKHDYLPAMAAGMRAIDAQFPLATLDDYLDHIQHVVEVAGIDHVGLASDFDGGGGIIGWLDASQTYNVEAGLRRRGFSTTNIAKISSGNLLRVWHTVERAAAPVVTHEGKPSFDAMFDATMARYRLPGLAVGVIENGKVVYTRTAGERIAGSGQKIDADTLFKIASNSKAMTTALLARLVDAGKLRWDDPVTKYLPSFRMHDAWVTREMQVRDLLIHNSGLREGAGDLMLWPEPNRFTRNDIIGGLAYLKPQRSFRSGYAYDNLLYVVAGEVAAAAGGASYEQLVRREVFEPLGLARCQVGMWKRDDVGNVAQPHMRKGDSNLVIDGDGDIVPAITSASAGGIRCSLRDMLSWAQNWLVPTDRQQTWLSPKQRAAVWTAQTPMPISRRRREWDGSHVYAYGYGWRLADVDDVWTVSHTGTLNGMYSMLTLLPELRSGFVIMTNGVGDEARTVLGEALVKHFTAPGQAHSVDEYAARIAREPKAPDRANAPDTSSRTPATAAQMTHRLGIWRDPWFGEVALCERDGKLRFSAAKSPLLSGTVMRVGERYLVDWDDDSVDAEPWLDFAAASWNAPPALTLAKVDPDADFSFDYEDLAFTRVRDCD
jgi:microsomal dipeptidase-like Zn-dependent dipeptidase/CubicO group peptidase (beta-lactamase class C family)